MEFHEKLQQLRRQRDLTQEQLAQQLFVSRSAVSKWESGRGYPNLEALKDISALFSVSIDELLSNNELIELAETENRANIRKFSGPVHGALDAVAIALLFLPLFGQRDGELIRAVTLWAYTDTSAYLRALCFAFPIVLTLLGILEILSGLGENEKGLHLCKPCACALYAAAILFFVLARQPYATVFLFLLFLVKILLILREGRIR